MLRTCRLGDKIRKLLMIAAVAVFGLSSVNAQENVVKVNPLGLLFGSAELSYERVLGDKSSVEIAVAYTTVNATFSNSLGQEDKISGIGAEGKYKLYFSSVNDAPRGWYGPPVVTYSSITGKSGTDEGTVSIFGAGAIAGYQWVFGGDDTGFALDPNLGAQYLNVNTSGDISGTSIDGILPRLGLALGYAF